MPNSNTFVLRLQDINGQHGLNNTLKHWEESQMYDDKQINDLASSNINSLKEPTSIPSPFARIALAKTAFNEVAKHGDNALASYKQIVSNSLDVGEIFFTYEKWKNKVDIIEWKYGRKDNSVDLENDSDLKKLEKGHHQLYKTLKTFLENDAKTYNFDKLKSIYILKHKSTGKMIGATSPCTLFFSSANDLKDVDIQLDTERSAFKDIVPLHKRDWNYQKFLYTWMEAYNENITINEGVYKSIFYEFRKYLEIQKGVINRNEEIDALSDSPKKTLDNSLKKFDVPNVEVLGKPIYYTEHFDISILNNEDLLEDTILRLSGTINNTSFLNGNLNNEAKFSYLLPLKDKVFKYFSIEDLKNNDAIRIREISKNLVIVNLKHKSGRYFEKRYEINNSIKDLDNFDCLLYPNVKFEDNKDAFYRFGVFSEFNPKKTKKHSIKFYDGEQELQLSDNDLITRNRNDSINPICEIHSLNQKLFDRIKVSNGNVSGVLIPTLPTKGSTEEFVFSVDFGTTNTHIEYRTERENTIRPFNIEKTDKQVEFLIGKNDAFKLISDIDFIPTTVGSKGDIFNFPIRTSLSLAKNRGQNQKIHPFTHGNIVIPYEKRQIPSYNKTITQLKWESDEDEMKYYIDSLCYMLRNKVVLNGGKLSNTKIIWFYPLSMAGSRSKIIESIWKVSYAKYFLGVDVDSVYKLNDDTKKLLDEKLSNLPESIAPYLFYKDDTNHRDAISNLVSIDIGGGTTDIVFVEEQIVKYVTSFRFAANSIFGLGEYITPVVSKYQSEILDIIESHDDNFKLENLYNSIINTEHGDLASFFFSLSENEMMKDVQFDFNTMLKRDNNQKLIFILFYTAIIYHTAQIVKIKSLPLPRHITFSGNGSRLVTIIGDNQVLEELSKLIFEKVLDKQYNNSGLNIIHNTINPKEVTCKGGIKAVNKNYTQTQFHQVVLLGIDDKTLVTDKDTYADINVKDYAYKAKEQAKEFIDFVINNLLHKNYTKGVVPENYIKALSLNPKTLQIAKEEAEKYEDLTTSTENKINEKINMVDSTTEIEESFFFYPIVTYLKNLSDEINKMI